MVFAHQRLSSWIISTPWQLDVDEQIRLHADHVSAEKLEEDENALSSGSLTVSGHHIGADDRDFPPPAFPLEVLRLSAWPILTDTVLPTEQLVFRHDGQVIEIRDDIFFGEEAEDEDEDVSEGVPSVRDLELHPDLEEDGALAEFEHPAARWRLLHTMSTSHSREEVWNAYYVFSLLPHDPKMPEALSSIPVPHLRRICRLLASGPEPRTRTQFLRLLSVSSALHREGGQVRLWQWNALINLAGQGWRRTRLENFTTAIGLYGDMVHGKAPGTMFFSVDNDALEAREEEGTREDRTGRRARRIKPDIVTHSMLLDIAARTGSQQFMAQAAGMLEQSGLRPNVVSHTSMLGYFTRKRDLAGVRATLLKMRQQGIELNVVALNACIWAYAYNGRVDIAEGIYRVMRHRIVPETEDADEPSEGVDEDELEFEHELADEYGEEREESLDAVIEYLEQRESIVISSRIVPDKITYHTLMQGYAYHGDLVRCLRVFSEMLSTPNLEAAANRYGRRPRESYTATVSAFRSIFLGFSRHARSPPPTTPVSPQLARLPKYQVYPTLDPGAWSLENFDQLFDSFLDLPESVQVQEHLIWWVVMGCGRVTGNDAAKMVSVIERMERRYGKVRGTRLMELCADIYRAACGDGDGSDAYNNTSDGAK